MEKLGSFTRLFPLGLMLAFCIVLQALVMTQHGHASSVSNAHDFQTIIICSDGEFREILIDANGNPVEKQNPKGDCPLCTVAGLLYLQANTQQFEHLAFGTSQKLLPTASFHKAASREPETANCLDPPLMV